MERLLIEIPRDVFKVPLQLIAMERLPSEMRKDVFSGQ